MLDMGYLRLDTGSCWRETWRFPFSDRRIVRGGNVSGLPSDDLANGAFRLGLGPARRGVDGVQLPVAFEAFQGVHAAVDKGDS